MKKYWVHMVFDYEIETDDIDTALKVYTFPDFTHVVENESLVDYKLECGEVG